MICQQELDALIIPYVEQECKPLDDGAPQAAQRKDPRWEVFDHDASLHHRGTECWVRIRDLSVSGMRIADVPEALCVGETVQIVTMLGRQGTLDVACQVMHVFEMTGARYAGLKFVPRGGELGPIAAYLQENAPAG